MFRTLASSPARIFAPRPPARCSTYTTYEALEADFVSGALHPGDLKASLTGYINAMLEPVRKHFASGEPAKLLEAVKRYRVTR